MSYTDKERLRSLTEVRDLAIEDLTRLLRSEHVPYDVSSLIAKERQVISDLNSLIYEEQVKSARETLKQLALCEFSGGF
jgi:hypothetical protein